jgi:LemA protein
MVIQNDSNPQPEKRIADDTAEDVLALAARYSSERQESYSKAELIQAGSEVNIPAACIEQAIQDIGAQQRQASLDAQVRKEQRQLLMALGWGGLAIASGLMLWATNALTSASSRVDAAWAQVENQLQRRAELLPALLLIAQAQQQKDPTLLQSLQDAGLSAKAARTTAQHVAASQQVDAAVATFNTTVLAAHGQGVNNVDIGALKYEIIGTANRLAVERMRFNQAVEAYNRKLGLFPHSLVGKALGMKKRAFFTTQPVSASATAPSPVQSQRR